MEFSDDQLERYARHIILKEVGGAGQMDLLDSRVLVIGAGGLGAPLLMYLAAAGVGHIGVVDGDVVDLSNLQRQIIHETSDIGVSKAVNAAKRMRAINPDVDVAVYANRFTADNADSLIAGYDIIADGCDNFTTRHLVSDTCVKLKKTLVSAALGPYEGQIATFKPYVSDHYPCYRCFMPKAPEEESLGTCADLGILGAVAGVVGSLQALEVIREILEIGDSLAGRMMLFDALSMQSRTVKLPRDPGCAVCSHNAIQVG